MGKIKELSSLLTNQIAAGEVIERPASVVKELIENAIDANSTRIEVHVVESGLKSIQIIDNGDGMSKEDAVLSIKRHTTSKLYSPEQLFRIRTLGFRGEALASITSVSKTTILTCTGEEEGYKLVVHGGKMIEQMAAPSRKGTTILVEDLFYNTPARLKYVRTLQTELAHITDIISKASLAHPTISFLLFSDGNEMLRTIGNGDLRQAIAGNIGTTQARKMVAFKSSNEDFSVEGYTSIPELTRSNRQYLSIFINGRPIRNLALNKAIIAGYGSTLMIGRFPITVLKITMDYLLVDVNVHPTKQEVRVSKEQELASLVEMAIREAITQVQRIPAQTYIKSKQERRVKPEQAAFDFTLLTPMTSQDSTPPVVDPVVVEEPVAVYEEKKTQPQVVSMNKRLVNVEQVQTYGSHHGLTTKETLKLAMTMEEDVVREPFPELYYFGQMHGTYLFAQNEKGLYMIDQHAAQERIKYEQFKVEIGEVHPHQQQLLVPYVLDFSKKEYLQLVEKQNLLEEIGIHLEPFGTNSFQLQEHPYWIKKGEELSTIEAVIDVVLADEKLTIAKLRIATAIMMSCKQSIKANHHLSDMQARQLLVDLAKCQNPYNCPHGRPVLIHFSNKEMEHFFKRIQDSHKSPIHE